MVRMRPTSTWTAPPSKMLGLTVPPHGTVKAVTSEALTDTKVRRKKIYIRVQ